MKYRFQLEIDWLDIYDFCTLSYLETKRSKPDNPATEVLANQYLSMRRTLVKILEFPDEKISQSLKEKMAQDIEAFNQLFSS